MSDFTCKHPPSRLWSWKACGVQCVACCECGEVLTGGVTMDYEPDWSKVPTFSELAGRVPLKEAAYA